MKAEGVIWTADRLDYPARTLLALAGPPGAGKTTLARRLLDVLGVPRLEIDALALEEDEHGDLRGLGAAAGLILERAGQRREGSLVVDTTAANPLYREALVEAAAGAGLEPHLLGVDATAAECAAALRARGEGSFRAMPEDVFDHYQSAWEELKRRAAAGQLIAEEGWCSVAVLDRRGVARLKEVCFG